MRWSTKSRLLLSTAILLTGVSIASAQGMREGGQGRGHERPNAGVMAPGGGNEAAPRRSTGRETTGQAPREESPNVEGFARPETSGPRDERRGEQRGQVQRDRSRSTTGQAGRDEERTRRNAAERSQTRDGSGRRAEQRQNAEQRTTREGRANKSTEGHSTTGTNARTNGVAQNRSGATNTLRTANGRTVTAQQRATIRDSVLQGRNVPRARNVHFDVRRGVFVPDSVSFVMVSAFPELLDVFPYYRDDSFFVTEDEIVFVGADRRIVDVLPIGVGGTEAYAAADVYVFRGHNFCFYFDGWNGPGWYRCGWAWRSGLGWGGVYGWNDWYYAPAFARFGRSFHGDRRFGHDRHFGNEFRGRPGTRETTGVAPRESRSVNELRERGGRAGEFDRSRGGTRETTGAGTRENFQERPMESNRGRGAPSGSALPQAGPASGAGPGGGAGGERGEHGGGRGRY